MTGSLLLAAIVITSVDHSYLRDDAERLLSHELGREVTIDGPMHLTVRRKLRLSVERLRIASVDWTEGADLLSVGFLSATIKLESLFFDEIEFESLTVKELLVSLEVSDEGENNWTLGQPQADLEKADSTDRPRIPVRFEHLSVTQAQIVYRSPAQDTPLLVSVDDMTQLIAADKQAELAVEGKVNSTPFRIQSAINSIESLNALGTVDFRVDGKLGEITLHADVHFDEILEPRRPRAALSLSGPDIQYLADILKMPGVQPGPMNVEISLQPGADLMTLDAVAHLGRLDVQVESTFDDLQHLNEADLSVSAQGADAEIFGRFLGLDNVPAVPFAVRAQARKSKASVDIHDASLVLGDARLDATAHFDEFPRLGSARATLDMAGPRLEDFGALTGLHDELQGPFSVRATLNTLAGGIANLQATAATGAATLTVSGKVTDQKGLADTRLDVHLETENLAEVSMIAGLKGIPPVRAEASASIHRRENATDIEDGIVRIAGDSVRISGIVSDQPTIAGTHLKFGLQLQDVSRTLMLWGIDEPTPVAQALEAAGELEVGKGVLRLTGIDGEYAGITFNATAKLDQPDSDSPARLATRLNASSSDISHFLARRVAADPPGAIPLRLAVDATVAGDKLDLKTLNLELGTARMTASGEVSKPPVYTGSHLKFP